MQLYWPIIYYEIEQQEFKYKKRDIVLDYFFITGTSSGLGYALAKQLTNNKNNFVVGFARHLEIERSNYSHKHIDLSSVDNVLDYDFPNINNAKSITLINNAGVLGEINYLGNLSDERLASTMLVDLVAPTILCNKFMRRYKSVDLVKTIINIGSGASKSPYDGWGAYCASKAGLEMLSDIIHKEQEINSTGFRIHNIAPGVVDTKMQEDIRSVKKTNFSRIEKFVELKETNQLYSPDDVATEIIRIIKDPSSIQEVSHRIQLG